MSIPKFPALSIGLLTSLLAAITQVQAQLAGHENTPLQWALIVVPAVAGFLVHNLVVPVKTIRDILTGVSTTTAAVTELANKVDVAISDTPVSHSR